MSTPQGVNNDPAQLDVFRNAEQDLIPDPTVYSDWFDKADERQRKIAVGARRYAAVNDMLPDGQRPSWQHFVNHEDGELLTLDELRGETGAERAERMAGVDRLLADRRAAVKQISMYGFDEPGYAPTFGTSRPIPRQEYDPFVSASMKSNAYASGYAAGFADGESGDLGEAKKGEDDEYERGYKAGLAAAKRAKAIKAANKRAEKKEAELAALTPSPGAAPVAPAMSTIQPPALPTDPMAGHPFAGLSHAEQIDRLHEVVYNDRRGQPMPATQHYRGYVPPQGTAALDAVASAIKDNDTDKFVPPDLREVYEAARRAVPTLTIQQFHASLARLSADGKVRLTAFTRAFTGIENPAHALAIDGEVMTRVAILA